MRARLAIMLAAVGVAGAFVARALRRREVEPPPADVDPRAEELRRKLAESRAIVEEREKFEEAELPVDQAEPLGDPDARRRQVHDAGKAAVEEMRAGESP